MMHLHFCFIIILHLFSSSIAESCLESQSSSCFSDQNNRRIPAASRHPLEIRKRRVLVHDEEINAYKKRIRYENQTEKDRHVERRKLVESHLFCDKNNSCYVPGLQVSLLYGEDMNFCLNCLDPHEGGSHILTWESFHGPMHYHVDGKVAYAIPNKAGSKILNKHHVQNNIALVDRCLEVPIVDKVARLQKAGASAVIIVDDGRCDDNLDCGPVVGKRTSDPREGYGHSDLRVRWDLIHIPSVLISQKNGNRLKILMQLEETEVPTVGKQYTVPDDFLDGHDCKKR